MPHTLNSKSGAGRTMMTSLLRKLFLPEIRQAKVLGILERNEGLRFAAAVIFSSVLMVMVMVVVVVVVQVQVQQLSYQ